MKKKELNKNLKNKIAIVTGGSEGIGFAIASALVMNGVKVLLVSRNKKRRLHQHCKIEVYKQSN